MTKENYIYGQLLSVFLSLLDEDEKRHKDVTKINDAIRRIHHVPRMGGNKTYYEAADIVEKAMVKSWEEIPEGKNVTVNAMCWLIFNRHKVELKPYKLNLKHFERMSKKGVSGYAFQSAKVLNILNKFIKEQL